VGSPRSAASPQRQVAAKQAAKPIAEAAGVSPEILQARAYLQSTNPEPTKLARMNDLYTAINCNCWARAKMLEQIMEGYEEPLVDADPDLRSRRPECVQVVMRQAVKRTWDHVAKERLEDTRPTIPLGKRFWPKEKREIERFFPPRKCAYRWRHYAPGETTLASTWSMLHTG
jgi:hypothetical protein